jgi:hypothetical protein
VVRHVSRTVGKDGRTWQIPGGCVMDARTEGLISQILDKIIFTHKDKTEVVKIMLLGCSFQTIAVWDRHADGHYADYTYVNKNARQELQKLRSQNVYKIPYIINDEDEHELIFGPDQS